MSSDLRQSDLRVPFIPSLNRVEVLGMVGLRCRVDLHLATDNGQTTELLPFAIDSGASYSLINLDLADLRGIPVPPSHTEIELQLRTPTGIQPFRVRPGRIRCWWNADLAGYPFDWPVLFRVGGPLGSPSILGLGGVIPTCSWSFDGLYSPDAPYGALTLSDLR